ncbi:Uncharacterised protein [Candidatus Gugararchaeum adminiculabundum]|nr:Uncharacterised protein [Candidatus Gugararchaeum adminiculabundum]
MRGLPLLLAFVLLASLFSGVVGADVKDITPTGSCESCFTQPSLSIAVNKDKIEGQLYYYNKTQDARTGVAYAKLTVFIGPMLPANQLTNAGEMAGTTNGGKELGTGGSAYVIETKADGTFSVDINSIPKSNKLLDYLDTMGEECYLTLKFDPYVRYDAGTLVANGVNDCGTLDPAIPMNAYGRINYVPPKPSTCPTSVPDDYLDIDPCPCKKGAVSKPLLGVYQFVPYCLSKKALSPTIKEISLTDQCFPVFLILGLLGGAMFMQGKNPMASFDFSSPRLHRGQQYQMRTQSKNIALGGLFMSVMSFAQQKAAAKGQALKAKEQATAAANKSNVAGQLAGAQKTIDTSKLSSSDKAVIAKYGIAVATNNKKEMARLAPQMNAIRRKTTAGTAAGAQKLALQQNAAQMGLYTQQTGMSEMATGWKGMNATAELKHKIAKEQDAKKKEKLEGELKGLELEKKKYMMQTHEMKKEVEVLKKEISKKGGEVTNQKILDRQAEKTKYEATVATQQANIAAGMKAVNKAFIMGMIGMPMFASQGAGMGSGPQGAKLGGMLGKIPVIGSIASYAKAFASPKGIKEAFEGGFGNKGAQAYADAAASAGIGSEGVAFRAVMKQLPVAAEVSGFFDRYSKTIQKEVDTVEDKLHHHEKVTSEAQKIADIYQRQNDEMVNISKEYNLKATIAGFGDYGGLGQEGVKAFVSSLPLEKVPADKQAEVQQKVVAVINKTQEEKNELGRLAEIKILTERRDDFAQMKTEKETETRHDSKAVNMYAQDVERYTNSFNSEHNVGKELSKMSSKDQVELVKAAGENHIPFNMAMDILSRRQDDREAFYADLAKMYTNTGVKREDVEKFIDQANTSTGGGVDRISDKMAQAANDYQTGLDALKMAAAKAYLKGGTEEGKMEKIQTAGNELAWIDIALNKTNDALAAAEDKKASFKEPEFVYDQKTKEVSRNPAMKDMDRVRLDMAEANNFMEKVSDALKPQEKTTVAADTKESESGDSS